MKGVTTLVLLSVLILYAQAVNTEQQKETTSMPVMALGSIAPKQIPNEALNLTVQAAARNHKKVGGMNYAKNTTIISSYGGNALDRYSQFGEEKSFDLTMGRATPSDRSSMETPLQTGSRKYNSRLRTNY